MQKKKKVPVVDPAIFCLKMLTVPVEDNPVFKHPVNKQLG